jgi:perosamine synthetase
MSKVIFPIHHTFGPLVTRAQWKEAFLLQFKFWKWKNGKEKEDLKKELGQRFGESAILFGSGRDALLATFRAIGITPGDEIILQGFTCTVVPNSIHAAGGVPVYCDTDPQTLSLDIAKFHRTITHRTRAVICQHTFGIPAETKKIKAICEKRGIMLIEDCAHIIPDDIGKQMSLLEGESHSGEIGLHGDAVLLSFGRDKAISGVTGGAVITKHAALAKVLNEEESKASHMSMWRIMNLIGYPIRYRFAKWLWRLPLGPILAKAYLRWIQKIGFLVPVLTKSEKKGKGNIFLKKIPNACATLALQQLKGLHSINSHRRKISDIYKDAAKKSGWHMPEGTLKSIALQKFPVFARDADGLRRALKGEEVYLDDGWCGAVVNPKGLDQESFGYAEGACPISEDIAKHIVSLPTHPTMNEEQAKYLVHALRFYLG